MQTVRKWLNPPHFPDNEEKNNQVKLLNTLMLNFSVVLLAAIVLYVPIFSPQKFWAYLILLPMLVALVAGRFLLYRDRITLAVGLNVFTAFFCFLFFSIHSSGPFNPALFFLASVIMVTGFALNIRAAGLMVVITILVGAAAALMMANGVVFPIIFQFNPYTGWITFLLGILFMSSARNLILNSLYKAMADVRRKNALLQQTEQSLRESEEKYRAVVENSPDAIAIYVNGKIVYANPASAALMHANQAEDLIGMSVMDFVHPASRALVGQRMAAVQTLSGLLPSAEEKFVRLDGSEIDVEVRPIRITYNKRPAVQLIVRNITDRKKLEDALRTSEAQYRRIFENANDGVVVLDTQSRLILLNQQLANLLGYTIEELTGRTFESLVDPAEIALHRAEMISRAQGKDSVYERCLVCKNGARIFARISARALLDEAGNFQGSFGMVMDITARKQAEADLARMALALDIAPSAITVHDFEGRFLYANQRCFDLHGYTRDEFMALNLRDLDSPVSAKMIPERIQELMARGEASFEVVHIRKNGSLLPLDVSVRITLWGETQAILSVATDITERKQAEQIVRDSEERLRAVVQTANDGIVTLNPYGTIISWNPAAQNIFGYSASEALRLSIDQILPDRLPAPDSMSFEDAAAAGAFNAVSKTMETFGVSKDGRRFPVEMSLAEWKMQGETFFTIVVRDVSERQQRQTELQAITTLGSAMRAAQNRAEMLPIIVDQLKKLLVCETISVEIIDSQTGEAVVEAAGGLWEALLGTRQPPGTGANAFIAQTRKPYVSSNVSSGVIYAGHAELLKKITAGAGVPLIAQDQLIGFIWMGRRTEITEPEVRLLAAVADIAANALHRATLHERTQKDAFDLSLAYNSTLEGWAHALELRDQETEGHTRRVVQMTVELAQAMGIEGQELENIRRGSLLHDIGKMGIPDSVLLKPGTLNEREWEIMRRHPEYAYQLLSPINYLRPVLDIPYCHHEKWDGTGYPHGIKAEQIPLGARIFAVVDVWDALCSNRPYRGAWDFNKARQYIVEQSGKHFDPRVVAVFLDWLEKERSGDAGF